ncbi:MAG: hypothetical protein ACXWW9_06420 [Actinomycetota bacterium]
MLRRSTRWIAVTLMTASLTLALTVAPASAQHLPSEACSPSGDVCRSVRKVDGVRRLRIFLAAEYFERYRLCVTGPDDTASCHTYRIRDLGATFGSSIAWRANFPFEGPGAYTVVWRFIGGGRIGRALGFHGG